MLNYPNQTQISIIRNASDVDDIENIDKKKE